MKQRHAWVIGASTGIGAALAKQLLSEGFSVTVSARNEKELQELSQGKMKVVPLDVTNGALVDSTAAELANAGELDLVVVSAGYWKQDSYDGFDNESFRQHVQVNLVGFGNCVAAVIPRMQANASGHFVGISSVAGYRGMPGSYGYGATKAAQLNLMEALRASLRGTGVKVQSVSPGFVRTPMTSTNEFPMPFLIDADKAARAIARGIRSSKPEIVFPMPMAIAMRIARVTPQRIWLRLVGRR